MAWSGPLRLSSLCVCRVCDQKWLGLALCVSLLDANRDGRYYAGMPAVAVNSRGEIAVAWYDRRELPPESVDAAGWIHKSGYNIRFRVSTDGGQSWLPSVKINERTGRGDPIEARSWGAGMAVDAEGRFHPAWVSDSGGVQQIWTATVTLEVHR